MILGMSVAAFTLLHVIISLIGIASGIVVLIGMLGAHRMPGWTALFLLTTVLTSVTGFLFPSAGLDPAPVVGSISLVALVLALAALYAFGRPGFAGGAAVPAGPARGLMRPARQPGAH